MERIRQLVAAGLGGVLSTLVDTLLVVVLVKRLGWPVGVSALLASSVGAVVCFTANKYVAFRDRTPVRVGQLARFGLVAVASIVLTSAAMQIAVAHLHAPVVPARLVVAVLVFLAWAYPAQRRLVWRAALVAV